MMIEPKRAWKFIVLLGVVSLFADMTYEGARSITGPFFVFLGGSAAVTGFIAGLGEFIGYAVRVASGYFSDRSHKYWAITIAGYAVNLLAIPLLAFTHRWETAAVLVVLERFGKAIRTPARDVLLSHATTQTGRGKGFGLHEAMDQIGALTGPLLVALMLYGKGGYAAAFGILLIPALLALGTLGAARLTFPTPEDFEPAPPPTDHAAGFPKVYWIYMGFVAASIAGYAHFQVISYHFKAAAVFSDVHIPLLFALAMAVDGVVALIVGRLFDRYGWIVLIGIPIFSIPITPLVFTKSATAAVAGVVLWGAAMGIQETVMRAGLAELIHAHKRGLAFGLFNAVYGLAWFLGSTVMGVLYTRSLTTIIVLSIGLELISIPILFSVRRAVKAAKQR